MIKRIIGILLAFIIAVVVVFVIASVFTNKRIDDAVGSDTIIQQDVTRMSEPVDSLGINADTLQTTVDTTVKK